MPVILTSGYIDDSLIEKAARSGVQHVLYKPSTIQEFSAALDEILQASHKMS
jgi:response regulator of citrate/malate metabolism